MNKTAFIIGEYTKSSMYIHSLCWTMSLSSLNSQEITRPENKPKTMMELEIKEEKVEDWNFGIDENESKNSITAVENYSREADLPKTSLKYELAEFPSVYIKEEKEEEKSEEESETSLKLKKGKGSEANEDPVIEADGEEKSSKISSAESEEEVSVCAHAHAHAHKHQSRVENWEKTKAKFARNRGEAYTSYATKRQVSARAVGPACKCGCFDKIGMDNIKEIFNRFWQIGDFNQQNAYISKFVGSAEVKRYRVKGDKRSRQTRRIKYTVMHRDVVHSVCRNAFYSIHGIKEKRVRTVLAKQLPAGLIEPDRRGRAVPTTKCVLNEGSH